MTVFLLIYILIGLVTLMFFWEDVIHEDASIVLVMVFGWAVFALLALVSATLRRIPEWPVKGGGNA